MIMNQTDIISRIIESFNPIVTCEWLPDREVTVQEYNQMITARVRLQGERLANKYIKEETDAKSIRT